VRFGAAVIATAELKLIEIKGKRSAGLEIVSVALMLFPSR
jgi:hypothetical protein